jgi:outer membrane protein TolC
MPVKWLRSSVVAIVLAQCVCAAVVHAQQQTMPGVPSASSTPAANPAVIQLTLKQAVELALKQNPQRVIAKILLFESERNSQIARAPLLPQAAIDGAASLNQYNLQIVESQPRPIDAGPYQYLDVGPNFSQVLLNLPLIRAYQAGREGVKQARADERTAREIAVQATVNQYLLILRALADREAAQSRVDLAQRLYEQASQLQKNGIGLNIDTTRANVELQNEKQNLIDADTATRTTKYQLAALLDLPRTQELDVTDRLSFFDLPAMEKEALVTEALADRPEMRSFDSQQRIAHLNTDAAGEQRLPQLDFSGFWHYQAKHISDGVPGYTYEITLAFPLFTGGKIHAEEAKEKLEEQRVAESRRQLEAQIVSDVKTAFDQLAAARTSVDVANLGLKLAQDEVAQAQRRFAAGVTTNVEVITAQDALARASDNQIAALYNFNLSRALLARATGDIEGMYTK